MGYGLPDTSEHYDRLLAGDHSELDYLLREPLPMNGYHDLARELRSEAQQTANSDSNVSARLFAGADAIERLVEIIFSLLDERVK